MKILLISPSSGHWRGLGRSICATGKTFRFSMLSLLSVAACTPNDVEIRIIDEQVDVIPWADRFDLVGITAMTATAPRAYEIADRFRALNTPTVLGGMHPTFLPMEALEHADSVVCGEAEAAWPRVIEDAREGNLQRLYQAERLCDLSHLAPPPYHLLRLNHYSTYAVQATRGCDKRCSFCSVSAFHRRQYRKRPVESVIDEIHRIPSRFFIFVDDNLTADRHYAVQLFRSLIPLKKYWGSQSTMAIADDEELVSLAAESGCVGLFVGLETLSDHNLCTVEKSFHQAARYREWITRLHHHGIGVEAGVVFGFDEDDPTVFHQTLQALDDLEIDAAQFSIFTPLPGTDSFRLMEKRIVDRDWSHYDFHHAVFTPRRMNTEALKAGHDWVTREFYRPWRIARRIVRWTQRPRGLITLPWAAGVNFAYLNRIRSWGIHGWDPAIGTEMSKCA